MIAAPERCGRRGVVFDDVGDHLALSVGLLLGEAGHDVEVITQHLHAGPRAATHDLPWLMAQLEIARVRVTAQARVEAIAPGTVVAGSIWGGEQRTLEADTVVLCMRRRSDDTLHRALRDAGSRRTARRLPRPARRRRRDLRGADLGVQL